MINTVFQPIQFFNLVKELRNDCKQILQAKISQIQFLACGFDHIIFSMSIDKQDVIIFNRKQKIITTPDQNLLQIGKLLQNLYEQFMARNFSNINKYRWPRNKMYIQVANTQQMQYICQQLQNKVSSQNIQNIPGQTQLKLNRKQQQVYVCKNIFKARSMNDICVQFKPKSVLPDYFAMQTLQKLSSQFKLSVNHTIEILQKSQPIQKTRWYKKTQIKKSNKKLNQNPFDIFNIDTTNYTYKMPNFVQSKCYKLLNNLNEEQQNQVNKKIFQQIHQDKFLLSGIHEIQSIFSYSPNQIKMNKIQKDQNLNKLLNQLQQQLKKQTRQIPNLQNIFAYLRNVNSVSKKPQKQISNLCLLAQFLISLTWKDISIVYKSTYVGKQFKNSEIWIIDDYLKKINKAQENIKKDQQYLREYLKLKLKQSINMDEY